MYVLVKTLLPRRPSYRAVARGSGSCSYRYGIYTDKAFGVPMAAMIKLAKELTKNGKSSELAEALWATGWYEARMTASMVDDPSRLTAAKMDRWAKDFDNWGICDTVCFKLFDQAPTEMVFKQIEKWAGKRDEFIKRAGFALLACVALHDREAPDQPFMECMTLMEQGAADDRNFVKKAVSWAMRAVGGRSPELYAAVRALAEGLATPESGGSARWIGKDVLRALKPVRKGKTATKKRGGRAGAA